MAKEWPKGRRMSKTKGLYTVKKREMRDEIDAPSIVVSFPNRSCHPHGYALQVNDRITTAIPVCKRSAFVTQLFR